MGGVRPNASKNGQISPPTTVRAARGDGSYPNCASALQGARETASIHGSLGVIWRISVTIFRCRVRPHDPANMPLTVERIVVVVAPLAARAAL
jgi:sugar (pentulose or hexulose) kinase